MNEEIIPYTELVNQFNVTTGWGGPVNRLFAEHLLEQIRLRDAKIAEWEAVEAIRKAAHSHRSDDLERR